MIISTRSAVKDFARSAVMITGTGAGFVALKTTNAPFHGGIETKR